MGLKEEFYLKFISQCKQLFYKNKFMIDLKWFKLIAKQ
jgi:hypothetical protein